MVGRVLCMWEVGLGFERAVSLLVHSWRGVGPFSQLLVSSLSPLGMTAEAVAALRHPALGRQWRETNLTCSRLWGPSGSLPTTQAKRDEFLASVGATYYTYHSPVLLRHQLSRSYFITRLIVMLVITKMVLPWTCCKMQISWMQIHFFELFLTQKFSLSKPMFWPLVRKYTMSLSWKIHFPLCTQKDFLDSNKYF